jgi:hypothetical protein
MSARTKAALTNAYNLSKHLVESLAAKSPAEAAISKVKNHIKFDECSLDGPLFTKLHMDRYERFVLPRLLKTAKEQKVFGDQV